MDKSTQRIAFEKWYESQDIKNCAFNGDAAWGAWNEALSQAEAEKAKLLIDLESLRAKVASAEVLAVALRKLANADVRNTHKVEKCTHDKYGYEDCEQCIYDYADEALSTYDKISEVKHDTK